MFLLVFTLFSGFFLAGCDLISPEKVEDLSKELCETNPDSELCNIENLNDLEEDVIADLVEKAFLELKSANTDTCADYFSVTNPNLIDECEKAVNNLIPNGVTTFEVLSISKSGEFYTIKGKTNNADEFVEIKVSVAEVEGKVRITTWVATSKIDAPLAEAMTAEELITAFFEDQGVLSDDALCNAYYDLAQSTLCNEIASEFEMNISYTVVSVSLVEAGLYKAVLMVNGNSSDTKEIQFRLDSDDDGDSILTALYIEADDSCDNDCDGLLDIDETFMVFKQFALDYFDSSITNDELGNMYFGGMLPEGMKESREEEILAGNSVTVISIMPAADGFFKVELEFTEGTEVMTQSLNIRVNRIEMAYKIEFEDGEDNDCDGEVCYDDFVILGIEETMDVFTEYFSNYSNSNVSDQMLANMYFAGMFDETFKTQREQDLLDGVMFTLIKVEVLEDGYYDISFEETRGNDILLRKRPGRVHYSAMDDIIIIEFMDDMEYMFIDDINLVESVFKDFVIDYLDSDTDDDYISDMYFAGNPPSGFLEERMEDLADGLVVTYQSIMKNDDYGMNIFDVTILVGYQGYEMSTEVLTIGLVSIGDKLMLVLDGVDDDCNGDSCIIYDFEYDMEILAMQYSAYFYNYTDKDMTTETFVNMFLGGYAPDEFYAQREMDLIDGLMITFIGIDYRYDEDGVFDISFEETRGNDIILRKRPGRIRYSYNTDIIVEWHDFIDYTFEYDMSLVEAKFKDLMRDYADATIDDSMIGEMYFAGNPPMGFFEQRQEDLNMGVTLTFVSIMENVYGMDGFYDVMFNEMIDGMEPNEVVVSVALVYIDEMMMLVFDNRDNDCDGIDECYYEEPVIWDIEEASNFANQFLMDLANSDITWDMLDEMYFNGTAPAFLEGHRAANVTDGVSIDLLYVEYSTLSWDNFFDVSYEAFGSNGFSQEHLITIRVHKLDTGLWVEFFDETNECHVDPELCYPSPYELDAAAVEEYFQLLLTDFNDQTMTFEMINEKYFFMYAPMSFETLYADNLVLGGVAMLYAITPHAFLPEGFFTVEVTFTYADGSSMNEMFDLALVNDGYMKAFIMYDDDGFQLNEMEYEAMMFFESILDDALSSEYICMKYDAASVALCETIINNHRDNFYYAYAESVNILDDGSVEVLVVTLDESGFEIETNVFIFGRTVGDNPVYIENGSELNNPLYSGGN